MHNCESYDLPGRHEGGQASASQQAGMGIGRSVVSHVPWQPMSASVVAVGPSIMLCCAQGKTRSHGTEKTFSGSLYLAVVEAMM